MVPIVPTYLDTRKYCSRIRVTCDGAVVHPMTAAYDETDKLETAKDGCHSRNTYNKGMECGTYLPSCLELHRAAPPHVTISLLTSHEQNKRTSRYGPAIALPDSESFCE